MSAGGGGDQARRLPPEIHLHGAAAEQRFIVVATRADGVTEDVTARAKATLADGKHVRLEGNLCAAGGRRANDAHGPVSAGNRRRCPSR